jgi:ketosteroid isomerase-like protein
VSHGLARAREQRDDFGRADVGPDRARTLGPCEQGGQRLAQSGAPATGRQLTVANVQVLRVRDGLIVGTRDYHDHARLAAVSGSRPTEGHLE